MKRQHIKTLSLVITTFTYLLIGAAVFDSLESENDEKKIESLKGYQSSSSWGALSMKKKVYMTRLKILTLEWFSILEIRADLQRKYGITNDDYAWIEQMVIETVPHKAGPQWKFAGAFYFATVVMAMIG